MNTTWQRRAEKKGLPPLPSIKPRSGIQTTMSDAFIRRYAAMALDDITIAFELPPDVATSVADQVAVAVFNRYAGNEFVNGHDPRAMLRHELLKVYGGEAVVGGMVQVALDDRPDIEGKDLRTTLVNNVRAHVLLAFLDPTTPLTTSLQTMVRERISLVIPGEKPVLDKGITARPGALNLTDLLVNKLRSSPDAQLKRAAQLQDGLTMLRVDPKARNIVFELTNTMVSTGFPPEMFHHEVAPSVALSAQQLNDLAVNFLFWFIEQHPELQPHSTQAKNSHLDIREHQKMVAYLRIFRGMDYETIAETLCEYDEKKDAKPNKPEKLSDEKYPEWRATWRAKNTSRYHQVADTATYKLRQILERDGETYLKLFSHRARVSVSDGTDVIRNHSEVAANVRDWIDKTPTQGRSAYGIQTATTLSLEFPETEYGRTIEEIDVVLLQRGNLTAKNRALVGILRFIGKFVHNPYGRKLVANSQGSFDYCDIFQEVAETVLKKLALFNPQRSRITTYMGWWMKQTMEKLGVADQLVRVPSYIITVVATIANNPEMDDKQIQDHITQKYRGNIKVSLAVISTVRKLAQGGRYVFLDASLDHGGDDDRTLYDVLKEMRTVPRVEKAIDENARLALVERVLTTLSPRDAHIIRARVIDERTLEDVGEELGGMTRERVRQIQEAITDALKGEDVYGEDNGELKRQRAVNYFVVTDEAAFDAWLDHISPDPTDKRIMRLWMGLAQENHYKRAAPSEIFCSVTCLPSQIKNLAERVMIAVKKSEEPGGAKCPFLYLSKSDAYRQAARIITELDHRTGYSTRPDAVHPAAKTVAA